MSSARRRRGGVGFAAVPWYSAIEDAEKRIGWFGWPGGSPSAARVRAYWQLCEVRFPRIWEGNLGGSGHKRLAEAQRDRKRRERQDRYEQPDATEQVVQDLVRQVREELHRRPAEHGVVSALLAVAARYAARHLVHDFEIVGQERQLEEWITAKCGDVMRCERGIDASIEGYLAWQATVRARMRALTPLALARAVRR